MGLLAFKWGRMAVIDPDFVRAEIKKYEAVEEVPEISAEARAIVDSVGASGETKRLLEIRVPDLIDYQDAAYARRYADVVKKAVQAEQKAAPGQSGYAESVARFLYKLMAYKDEYEVARLHADPKFIAKLDAQFKDGYTLQYHLAPPMFSKRDPMTGELHQEAVRPAHARGVPLPRQVQGPARRRARHLRQDRGAAARAADDRGLHRAGEPGLRHADRPPIMRWPSSLRAFPTSSAATATSRSAT